MWQKSTERNHRCADGRGKCLAARKRLRYPWCRGISSPGIPDRKEGTALAEILFGEVNPSGKLPVSFEKQWSDNATYRSYWDDDKDKHVPYSEGLFLGYRHFDKDNIEPLYPFGFGLSYTSLLIKISLYIRPVQMVRSASVLILQIPVTGMVQRLRRCMCIRLNQGILRAVKELKAFTKVFLKPGETKRVELDLGRKAFEYYDVVKKEWAVEPGQYEIQIGSSSSDIRLTGLIIQTGN